MSSGYQETRLKDLSVLAVLMWGDRDLFSCCFVTDGAASRGLTVFGSSEICCQEISANIYLEKKYLKTTSRKKFSIIYEESSNP